MPFLSLWTRRLWPYVLLVAIIAGVMLSAALVRGRRDSTARVEAHRASVAMADTVHVADTVFQHDTVVARRAVIVYRTARDTALVHLTDTVAVKEALSDCDSAIGTLSAALNSAGRLIQAHVRYEGALRAELVIADRLRAPRYALASRAGMEWGTHIPVTELESTVRLTARWSVVGRLSKRWGVGDETRRTLLASYAF